MHTKPTNKRNTLNRPADFIAWQAIEALYWLIVDLEAMANAAGQALEDAPPLTHADDRRAMGRISSLTQRTAETATAALKEAEGFMQQVEAYLAEKHSAREAEAAAKRKPARTTALALATVS